ncbi:transcriptional regulatory protein pro-1 [Fusarium mundagurra]|uniref:Transcriptional regulatory protein pro-1 n=1 Tax=Fusarium mundagurra TaxID=1567541 RepID=A0A8H6D622_9HYPO|nr:transcriptional regulatory protein pro-1 [Fusarium mundagurra]
MTSAPLNQECSLESDGKDQSLREYFIQFILPTIFPIFDSNQHRQASSELILSILESNGAFRHCCLCVAAQHLKSHTNGSNSTEQIDKEIMRHRYASIEALRALKKDEKHQQTLETTLGLAFSQAIVGHYDDDLPDDSWDLHFQTAMSLVQKLKLPSIVSDPAKVSMQTPFIMSLSSWIDILGATMKGRSPTFALTYRKKILSQFNPSLGLRELMGCDDRVMHIISEIACLESFKKVGMTDFALCQHILALEEQIELTEMSDASSQMPFDVNGSLVPEQLTKNITIAFRIAARVFLYSLVPGFNPREPCHIDLVEKLTTVLQHIPSGPHGFDRNLTWVYLIGGSISVPDSPFRPFFKDRLARLGDSAKIGNIGRAAVLLVEVWAQNDRLSVESTSYIHWRDVMESKKWDFLLL